jgi:hypothetical protein
VALRRHRTRRRIAFHGLRLSGRAFRNRDRRDRAELAPGTKILAEIPNLYGPGFTAQMTYYETGSGAKVFAAGAFTLGGAATWQPVTRLLDNLWARLTRP